MSAICNKNAPIWVLCQSENTHLSAFSNRLKYAIANYARGAISYKSFAGLVDIPYRTLQNYLSGERSPNIDALEKFAAHGLNINWLITGKGSPFLSDQLDQKYIDKIFLACADDIIEKCLGSSRQMFQYDEKIRIISFMMARNYLGLGETIRFLLDEGYFQDFDDIEEMITAGQFSELYPHAPRDAVEMHKAIESVKNTIRNESLKPPKIDE